MKLPMDEEPPIEADDDPDWGSIITISLTAFILTCSLLICYRRANRLIPNGMFSLRTFSRHGTDSSGSRRPRWANINARQGLLSGAGVDRFQDLEADDGEDEFIEEEEAELEEAPSGGFGLYRDYDDDEMNEREELQE